MAVRRRRRHRARRLLIWLLLLAGLVLWTLWGNSAPQLTSMIHYANALPREFEGYRVVQVSDLHDARLGAGNARVIELVKQARPDLIVVTGDIIDSNRLNIDRSAETIRQLALLAPVYCVSGNHEAALRREDYQRLKRALAQAGAVLLEDQSVLLQRGGAGIQLVGLQDIGFYPGGMQDKRASLNNALTLLADQGRFTIGLSHRPELLDCYAKSALDLVLCGHAHGGQVRLPLIGGLFSPGQGLFPRYTSGSYPIAPDKTMIVSRGIGNSKFPLRVNNRPEVVVIELRGKGN